MMNRTDVRESVVPGLAITMLAFGSSRGSGSKPCDAVVESGRLG
jgi:hypothetical protein